MGHIYLKLCLKAFDEKWLEADTKDKREQMTPRIKDCSLSGTGGNGHDAHFYMMKSLLQFPIVAGTEPHVRINEHRDMTG